MFSCEVCGFFKNTFFYRTSLVTASENWILNEKFHGRSLGLNRPLQDVAQNLDDDFIMITLTSSSWHRGKISLNMLHTGGLCGVLGFTAPLILISKKFQSKYIYTLNSTFYKAVFFECLIDVGAAYKSYKTPRLVIFWLIFWTHSLSCFANGNVLSTPSRFIRQSKMNIQNFCLFVIFLRGHIN